MSLKDEVAAIVGCSFGDQSELEMESKWKGEKRRVDEWGGEGRGEVGGLGFRVK